MKPRLLQINTVCKFASTGRILEDISQKAIDNGWDSYIAYSRNPGNNSAKQYIIGNNCDIAVHGLLTRLFDMQGLASEKATKELVEYIKNIQPDIIHLHNIHGYYLNYPVLFRFLHDANIPIVWTFHDCWPLTGHCVYFTTADCDKWKTQCYDCPQKKTYPASLLLDGSKRNYKLKKKYFTNVNDLHIVTVSNWLKSIVSESFLQDKDTITIHNGIDINIFKPKEDTSSVIKKYDLPHLGFTILGVANIWEERKGINKFTQMRNILGNEFNIVLVGLTEKQIKSLPAGIIGIRRTASQSELAAIYSYADVFVNMSLEETLGMTTIEAMACGTPAIVNDSTACAEPLANGCGYKVHPNNLNEMIKYIKTIQSIGKSHFTKKCREHAVSAFNKNDCYDKYLRLYDSLLNTHNLF